jgi:hypothetical protein
MTAYWIPGGTDDEGRERPPVWIPEVGPPEPVRTPKKLWEA